MIPFYHQCSQKSYLRATFAFTFFLFANISVNAQLAEPIVYPTIHQPNYRAYISIDGNNANAGDSLNPVADFYTALTRIKEWTTGEVGNIYAEVILYSGTYPFSLSQGLTFYNPDERIINIGVRGIGKVMLDERLNSNGGATAMIHLLGSNIAVRNIKIAYASGHGTLFGYNWNNSVIVPHDIYMENIRVEQTAGHGILVGLGRFQSTNNPIQLPFTERVWIDNCVVTNAVNYNELEHSSWGSAIKMHYVKNGVISRSTSFNNGGEGIDLDDCNSVLIEHSVSHDNRSNVYFDKAENVIFRNNKVYSTFRSTIGLLLSTEVSSSLIQNYYLKNIFVYNNLFINTPSAVAYWMGTVGASQKSILSNLQIVNNTIVGKRVSGLGMFNFAYETDFLNSNIPARNVVFENLLWKGNVVAFNNDSIGKVFGGPLNPQPALTAENNLYSSAPNVIYNSQSDKIDTSIFNIGMPDSIWHYVPNQLSENGYRMLVPKVNYLNNDFNEELRFVDSTNVGAFEFDSTSYVRQLVMLEGCDSVWLSIRNKYIFVDSVFNDTINGVMHDTIITTTTKVYSSYYGQDSVITCNYAIVDSDTLYTDTLIAHHYQTTYGCDSLVDVHYKIYTTEALVSLVNDSLIVVSYCDSIGWLNCETMQLIEHNASYFVGSGRYAAICWKNNCSDTSACITIIPTFIENQTKITCDYKLKKQFNQLWLIPKGNASSKEIVVYEYTGKAKENIQLNQSPVAISALENGVYLIVDKSNQCPVQRISWLNN